MILKYALFSRNKRCDMAIKALEVVKGIEDAFMSELLKTPMELNMPISDPCDGCQYELNSTNGNPCYSCGKYKLTDKQPCEDCISRADILDAIETWDKFGVNAEQKLIRWQDHYVPYVHLDDVRNAIANMPSVTPSIPDVENNYNIGYNCGYADAMIDIAEGSESE